MCRHRKGQICDALGPRGIANGEVAAFGCDLHLLLPKLGFMFPCQRTERFAKRHELTVLLRLLTVESAGTTAVADPSDASNPKVPSFAFLRTFSWRARAKRLGVPAFVRLCSPPPTFLMRLVFKALFLATTSARRNISCRSCEVSTDGIR